MDDTVNIGDVGSNPTPTAIEKSSPAPSWNEEEGVLTLVEFRPQVPVSVSIGIQAARDPEKKRQLKAIFLDVLRNTGLISEAAKICKIPKSLAWQWRTDDIEFAYRWDTITKAEILPHLESEAIRRAMNGSDLLLMFLMKAYDRQRFDDKAAEKIATAPHVTIQMVDVDKSLIAISGNNKQIPAAEYATGKLLDGKKNEPTAIDAEYVTEQRASNESAPGTERASKI